ncbi:MAG: hypothetical protein WCQ21_27145, partial [Verrucomicrobiota bacterium]
IYADGPKKGQGQLQLSLTVQFVQKGAAETIIGSDSMLAKVDLDPPLDLATGHGKLVCRGAMQELLSGLGVAAEGASLTLAGYVEYVRPTESPFLVRVPGRVDFGGVSLGSNAPARRITLCNLGESPCGSPACRCRAAHSALPGHQLCRPPSIPPARSH